MRLFGEDPEVSRLLGRKVSALEIKLAELKRTNSELKQTYSELEQDRNYLKSVNEILTKENGELKRAMISAKAKAADPFADWPENLRAQIDYARLGYKEPAN